MTDFVFNKIKLGIGGKKISKLSNFVIRNNIDLHLGNAISL